MKSKSLLTRASLTASDTGKDSPLHSGCSYNLARNFLFQILGHEFKEWDEIWVNKISDQGSTSLLFSIGSGIENSHFKQSVQMKSESQLTKAPITYFNLATWHNISMLYNLNSWMLIIIHIHACLWPTNRRAWNDNMWSALIVSIMALRVCVVYARNVHTVLLCYFVRLGCVDYFCKNTNNFIHQVLLFKNLKGRKINYLWWEIVQIFAASIATPARVP